MPRIPVIRGVYMITCKATGQVYIGSSRDIAKRVACHFEQLYYRRHGNYKLQRAYNLYGLQSFTYSVLESCDKKVTRNQVYNMEQRWMDCTSNKFNILTSAKGHLKKKPKRIKK